MSDLFLKNQILWIKNNKFKVCVLIIFIIAMMLRIYAISNKTTAIFDVTSSFGCSTPNNLLRDELEFKYYWSEFDIRSGENYTAEELKKALFENKTDLKSIIEDVITLHMTTIDTQHPNLYYTLFRIWNSGLDYSTPKSMMVRGCCYNLIFFSLSFFFMFKLLSLIWNDKRFILLGLFFAFVSTGSISNTILIRAYQMFEAFMILSLYLFLKAFDNISNKDFKFSAKDYFIYPLSFSLMLLTHYYALVLFFILNCFIIGKSIFAKNIKFLKSFGIIFVLSILFVLLFCPLYLDNFQIIEHFDGVYKLISLKELFNFDHLLIALNWFYISVFNNFIFYIALFLFALIKRSVLNLEHFKTFDIKRFVIIFAIVLIHIYVVMVISPFYEDSSIRYVIVTFPVMGILLALLTYCFRKPIIHFFILLTLTTTFISLKTNLSMLNSPYKNLGVVNFYKDFSYYDVSKNIYNDKKEIIPVVIINRNWEYPNYIFYLPNNAIVRIEDFIDINDYTQFEEYILIDSYTKAKRHIKREGKDIIVNYF